MCSISGFSLAPGSTVNSRALANALLTEGEVRGTDASGWAFATRMGGSGMYRQDVPGSQLSLKGMPRKADTVILHTRFATQGSEHDNRNNHPQVGLENHITLVHNGVIYNDSELRKEIKDGHKLPEVDTSVIPSILEQFGTDGTEKIAGYAAVAWLDDRTGNTLNLSRLDQSPVNVARLLDGSIVFASTEAILARALMRLDLKWVGNFPDTFQSLDDGDYLQITDAKASTLPNLSWNDDYWYGRGTSSQWGRVAQQAGSRYTTPGKWEYVKDEKTGIYSSVFTPDAVAALENEGSFDADDVWNSAPIGDNFYAVDHDGDYTGFVGINGLLAYLKFQRTSEGPLTDSFEDGWVNQILDIGHIDSSLSTPETVSWVIDGVPADLDAKVDDGLGWLAEGLHILSGVMV